MIFLTSYAARLFVQRREMGAAEMVCKHFNSDALMRALDRAVGDSRR